ncbi:hypothetical protein N7466_004635 [Penicillium verhagenii]|uniref:uncharacterized protein n=1 Tax=Penicillium verhagenii TaxID=1562060 RepID=UPI002545A31E|nr:uncharacterized protein N7466_004635 [Penicillium verhagenii]KAJ5935088.1 hypothetical protein N7466_004635 [Penicillium verhagenii]
MTETQLDPTGAMSLRVSASMITLVFISLCLRAWARSKVRKGVLMEDILIVLAAVLFYANQGVFLYAILGSGSSGGSDFSLMTKYQMNRFLKYLFVEELLFLLGITATKFSILTFYRHIFAVPSFIRINWILMAICACWGIVAFFVIIFECHPVSAMWDYISLRDRNTCIPEGAMIAGFGIVEIPIDIMILAHPVLMVHNLKLPSIKRASLMGVFMLGGFVCVTCVVRVWFSWLPSTGYDRNIPASLDWTTVELASAIVCACLPTYGPLIQIQKRIASVRLSYGKMRDASSKESVTPSVRDSVKVFLSREQIDPENTQLEV